MIYFFIGTDLEKCLHHLLTNGSSAVNGCRQNESPNSWYVHQLMSCEVKSCVFVKNTSIMKTYLTLNHWIWPGYKFSIHNIAFSSENIILSELGVKQIKHRPQAKTVLYYWWILVWETTGDGLFHCRKRYYGFWTSLSALQDVYLWIGLMDLV